MGIDAKTVCDPADAERLRAENEALRTYLIAVCDEARSMWRNERKFRAIREAANHLDEPFSFEKVQRCFDAMTPDAERIAELEQELAQWRHCFICIECGRGKVDEDGCCTTCGRDAMRFVNGKLAVGYADAWEADVQRQTAKQIADWLLSRNFVPVNMSGHCAATLAREIRDGVWRSR